MSINKKIIIPSRLHARLRATATEAVEHDTWFRDKVQIGLDSANAGNLISAVHVEAKFAAKRAVTRRRLESSDCA